MTEFNSSSTGPRPLRFAQIVQVGIEEDSFQMEAPCLSAAPGVRTERDDFSRVLLSILA